MLRRLVLLAPALLPLRAHAAPLALVPPCGQAPAPPYPATGQAPNADVWTEPDLKRLSWHPPGCLRWDNVRTRLVAALAGQFRSPRSLAQHAARLSGVSALPGVRYWSVPKAKWMPRDDGAELRQAKVRPGRRQRIEEVDDRLAHCALAPSVARII